MRAKDVYKGGASSQSPCIGSCTQIYGLVVEAQSVGYANAGAQLEPVTPEGRHFRGSTTCKVQNSLATTVALHLLHSAVINLAFGFENMNRAEATLKKEKLSGKMDHKSLILIPSVERLSSDRGSKIPTASSHRQCPHKQPRSIGSMRALPGAKGTKPIESHAEFSTVARTGHGPRILAKYCVGMESFIASHRYSRYLHGATAIKRRP